ncbi:hypothetical protein ZWY2020_038209 [Hordeum vulgare]|nr:hypothetical protein ZWY2020_038209 [Hordeum vulgare]
MGMRDLVTGHAGCAAPGSSSSANPVSALADAVLGSSSKSEVRPTKPPSRAKTVRRPSLGLPPLALHGRSHFSACRASPPPRPAAVRISTVLTGREPPAFETGMVFPASSATTSTCRPPPMFRPSLSSSATPTMQYATPNAESLTPTRRLMQTWTRIVPFLIMAVLGAPFAIQLSMETVQIEAGI